MIIVIPARGGSKRIPQKNITLLAGKPLLVYTVECALKSGVQAPVYVSTEDTAIAKVAESAGAKVIRRPPQISTDTASTESALLHALENIEGNPEWVMTLPPTSPFRKPQTVRQFYDLAQSAGQDIDCFMSVTETRADFWRYDSKGNFVRLFPAAPRRQQDREPLFEENSAVYVTRISVLQETNLVLGHGRVKGVPIPFPEGFDINTPEDLKLAEALMHSV